MSHQDANSGFERRTKQAFDDSVTGLDAATRSRLTRARHRALAELTRQPGVGWRWSLVPVGTLTAVAMFAWVTVWQEPPTVDAGLTVASLNDLEVLLAEEDLEMLDEDLEFYGWLEEQPEFAGAADSVG